MELEPQRIVQVIPWMILLLPLAGFIVLAAFNSWIRRDREEAGAGILACGTVVVAFALTVWVAWQFATLDREVATSYQQHEGYLASVNVDVAQRARILASVASSFEVTPYFPSANAMSVSLDWIRVGTLQVPIALLIDRLTLLMLLVVTGVGALIHIYSLGYMARDPERVRYFSYLNLFTFFMLLLVSAGSLPLMFIGWEGVGLCSYLLIGFWFKKPSAAAAGQKAFIVNRIGDVGLILGTILAYDTLGTVDIVRIADAARGFAREGLASQVQALAAEPLGTFGPLTIVALLLFVGACGKSAQLPLHVWLPDAMEGPTPVSALIHAATMVTAGVYMLARLSPLYVKAPTALAIVAVVGLVTALMAGSVALVQTDIKKVLAYSTVSQLGFMFLACGVGAFGAAVFHLYTHAFFKALLFLGAGSVIHGLSGEQDLRQMGGLWRKLPVTFWTFVIGSAAIAGVPLLSGYFSKEAILHGTLAAGHPLLLGVAMGVAALTAFYMTRLVVLAFFGPFRGTEEQRHHLHESPLVMLVPLVLLAVGSLAAGYLDVPTLLKPAIAVLPPVEAREVVELGHAHPGGWLPWLVVPLVVLAIFCAGYLYLLYTDVPGRLARAFPRLTRALEAKWGFDDAFNWVARRLVVDGSSGLLWRWFDVRVIDGAVNGAASLVEDLARRTRSLQGGLVRGYALVMFGGAVVLLAYLAWR